MTRRQGRKSVLEISSGRLDELNYLVKSSHLSNCFAVSLVHVHVASVEGSKHVTIHNPEILT